MARGDDAQVVAGQGYRVVPLRLPRHRQRPRRDQARDQAASAVVGARNVDRDCVPGMGSEDFAFMPAKRPVPVSGWAQIRAGHRILSVRLPGWGNLSS